MVVLKYVFGRNKFMIIEPAVKEKKQEELEIPWRVVVLNDPVNLMNYVVMVFRKVFGFSENKATKHMMEVHQLGRSVVWSGNREQAEVYAYQLQHWRLQTVLEKDD
jgi:ATP-dependent Clp protease adaptor protein ClpS